jgi:DnaJ-class molecular chaperone
METFDRERNEYMTRFGIEPPVCHACKGDGFIESWNYSTEQETVNNCEICEGRGYYTVKTKEALNSAGGKQ